MTPFGEGLWVDTDPVRFLGMRLTATMAVLRLGDEGLLVFSPLASTESRRAEVEKLGTVAHLYAPNLFHHLSMGDWATAFPRATLHAPPGLARKRPDLRIDRVHGSTPVPGFGDAVDEIPIEGFRLEETQPCGAEPNDPVDGLSGQTRGQAKPRPGARASLRPYGGRPRHAARIGRPRSAGRRVRMAAACTRRDRRTTGGFEKRMSARPVASRPGSARRIAARRRWRGACRPRSRCAPGCP